MEKATLNQGNEILKLVAQSNISKPDLQALLESGRLSALLREFVKKVENKPVTFCVRVDYTRTPTEALKATQIGKVEAGNILLGMPASDQGVKESVKVVFFRPDKDIVTNEDLAKEYEKRGLKPDPYAVAAVNELNPDFSDKCPNATYWTDSQGKYCLLFDTYFDGHFLCRKFSVHRFARFNWERWWLGGVPA